MFGIGSTEFLLILIVALLVLGPKNLPKVAHKFGRAMAEFRKVSTEFQRTLNTEIAFEEQREKKAKAAAESKAVETAEKPAAEAVDVEKKAAPAENKAPAEPEKV